MDCLPARNLLGLLGLPSSSAFLILPRAERSGKLARRGEMTFASVSFSCLQLAVLNSSSVYWITPAMD